MGSLENIIWHAVSLPMCKSGARIKRNCCLDFLWALNEMRAMASEVHSGRPAIYVLYSQ